MINNIENIQDELINQLKNNDWFNGVGLYNVNGIQCLKVFITDKNHSNDVPKIFKNISILVEVKIRVKV